MTLKEQPQSIAEQQIWKKIEKLEEERASAPEKRDKEIDEEIASLKQSLAELSTPLLSKQEYIGIKFDLEEKEKKLQDLQEKYDSLRKAMGSISEIEQKQDEKESKCKFYKYLLEKYTELINETEKKTIGEIKGLVNSDDLTVQSIVSEILPENYEFEKQYLKYAEKCYSFLCEKLSYVDPAVNINFWMKPMEIISLGIADDEDIAVMLCSMLFALGDEKAFVVISELEDMNTHSFVITEVEEKLLLLDVAQKKPFNFFFGNKEEVLEKYSFEGEKIKRFLYKFNSKEYEYFLQPE